MIYALLGLLGIIIYQDIKDREVYLILLILGIGAGACMHYWHSNLVQFVIYSGINLLFLVGILLILWLYSKFVMRKKLPETLGAGDILFFVLFAVSFPTITFLTLFAGSLIFSLVLFIFVKKYMKEESVPLAGFQAIFLGLILSVNLIFNIVNLFAI